MKSVCVFKIRKERVHVCFSFLIIIVIFFNPRMAELYFLSIESFCGLEILPLLWRKMFFSNWPKKQPLFFVSFDEESKFNLKKNGGREHFNS